MLCVCTTIQWQQCVLYTLYVCGVYYTIQYSIRMYVVQCMCVCVQYVCVMWVCVCVYYVYVCVYVQYSIHVCLRLGASLSKYVYSTLQQLYYCIILHTLCMYVYSALYVCAYSMAYMVYCVCVYVGIHSILCMYVCVCIVVQYIMCMQYSVCMYSVLCMYVQYTMYVCVCCSILCMYVCVLQYTMRVCMYACMYIVYCVCMHVYVCSIEYVAASLWDSQQTYLLVVVTCPCCIFYSFLLINGRLQVNKLGYLYIMTTRSQLNSIRLLSGAF